MSARWPLIPLGDVLTLYTEYIGAPEPREYKKLSVKLYGKGVVLDTPANGAALKMTRHQIAKAGQAILSEIWGKKGAIGLVPSEGDGALCTSHFFLFDIREDRIDRRWLQALLDANYLRGRGIIRAARVVARWGYLWQTGEPYGRNPLHQQAFP